MYLQASHSSCKLEIYNYNLQKVGVFQKARSDKKIQAEACGYIVPQKCENFNTDLACSHNSVEKGRK